MSFAVIYLVQRFFYRLLDFFHHWYADASRHFWHQFFNAMENADKTLAIKITARHFFEPLYKDYSIVGRILGIIFRSLRILIGVIVYAFLFAVFALIYIAWISAPAIILAYALGIIR